MQGQPPVRDPNELPWEFTVQNPSTVSALAEGGGYYVHLAFVPSFLETFSHTTGLFATYFQGSWSKQNRELKAEMLRSLLVSEGLTFVTGQEGTWLCRQEKPETQVKWLRRCLTLGSNPANSFLQVEWPCSVFLCFSFPFPKMRRIGAFVSWCLRSKGNKAGATLSQMRAGYLLLQPH